MITRRLFLGGTIACACGSCLAAEGGCEVSAERAAELERKTVATYAFGFSPPEPVYKSGNELLDRAFIFALHRLSEDFDVLPAFAYFSDKPGGEAWALSKPTLNRNDGTIYFGLNMLKKLLARQSHPDAAIVSVAAHEFGHIVQYKHRIHHRLNRVTKHVELHADFLSGWFAGRRKLKNDKYPAAQFAMLAREHGSFNIHDPSFHGTPDERGRAVEAGFLASARDKLPLDRAIEAGITHVQHGGFKPGTVVPYTSFR